MTKHSHTKNIAIIGYGQLGRALFKVLKCNKKLTIKTWDKKTSSKQKVLEQLVFSADVIFLCIPSWCVRDSLSSIKNFISRKTLVVCMAKGIEGESLKTMDVVLKESMHPNKHFSILNGPMLANELLKNKKGFGLLATKNKNDFNKLLEIFNKTNLHINHSDDLRGVSLCGVLKNIYTLGFGVVDALGLGNNTKGKLSTMAVNEMAEIIKYLGGKEKTALTVAGMGDLITTAFSPYSYNRKAGEDLGKTGICCLQSEGTKSINSIVKLVGKKIKETPFLGALKLIILDNKNPKIIFSKFLK